MRTKKNMKFKEICDKLDKPYTTVHDYFTYYQEEIIGKSVKVVNKGTDLPNPTTNITEAGNV